MRSEGPAGVHPIHLAGVYRTAMTEPITGILLMELLLYIYSLHLTPAAENFAKKF
jgi:hypothetical protein